MKVLIFLENFYAFILASKSIFSPDPVKFINYFFFFFFRNEIMFLALLMIYV